MSALHFQIHVRRYSRRGHVGNRAAARRVHLLLQLPAKSLLGRQVRRNHVRLQPRRAAQHGQAQRHAAQPPACY